MRKCTVLIATTAMALAPIYARALSATPPPNGGTISIESRAGDGDYDPSTHFFVAAAAEALAARGFTVLDAPGHASYVAELMLSRDEVGTGLAKAPTDNAAIIPGGAPGVGAGVTIPFSTGRSRLVPVQRTRLELRVRKRGEEGFVWDGAAVTVREAGTRQGSDATVAANLSEAVLRDYPAEPDGVVGVP